MVSRDQSIFSRPTLWLVALMLFAGSIFTPSVFAQPPVGDVSGVIRNAETLENLDYANVVLTRKADGAQWGAMSLGGGRFFLRGIPVGAYDLKVLYLGYKPITRDLTVAAGEQVTLTFDLEVTVVKQFDIFTVEGEAVMVEVKNTEFIQKIGSEDLTDYAVDSVEDAVARQAGVVSKNGQLHVRGGRSGEISFRIDGVAVDDPLGGGALSVSTFSVANVQTVTGGQDPEYGNALSGVINIVTREGHRKDFELNTRFMTDDFGRQDRTYTNYDRFEFGFGGPTWTDNLTYFVSGDLRFSDQENFTKAFRPETEVDLLGVDLFKYRRRQFNDIKGSSKLAWYLDNGNKMTAEYTMSYTRWETYLPNWDVQGYARQLVRLPLIQGPEAGPYTFEGRYVTAHYGPWVDNMQNTSRTVMVSRENPSSKTIVREPTAVLNVRDTRGNDVLVAAAPVFIGLRYDQSVYSTVEEDSSFVALNSANRGPQNRRFNDQAKLVWLQNLNDDTFYTLKFAKVAFDTRSTVNDNKYPYDYQLGGINSPAFLGGSTRQYQPALDYYTDPDNPLFVTTSDWPAYSDELSESYSMVFDITSQRYEGHKLKTGVRLIYNDLQRFQLSAPARERQDRFTGQWLPGSASNIFHTFNPEASFYVQDRWEYEGMVLNGGFRWDMFSPGSAAQIEVDNEDIDRSVFKYKHQFSPRLGFAFPITDRDGFHFHYGRFVQFPPRSVLFASQSSIGNNSILGNPNLEAETTISYQAGIKHQFDDYLAMQFAVYNKDIFGLISATQVTDEATGNTVARSINKAYGNARGFEVTLERRFHSRWAFDLAYTYAFADGVASSPAFGANPDGLKFLPSQELPLDWDQRHGVAMSLRIAEPSRWAASLTFDYGSGFPWTPFFRDDRRQDPLLENSRRFPATYDLNLQAERTVNLYGQNLTLYLQGFNLINQDQVTNVGANITPGARDATAAYGPYLTETGKYGGAYLQDIDGDTRDDFVPINDPRIFGQHRLFRIGMAWSY